MREERIIITGTCHTCKIHFAIRETVKTNADAATKEDGK